MRISDERIQQCIQLILHSVTPSHTDTANALLDLKDARIELARLRDAVNVALGHHTGGMDGDWRNCDLIELLRSVLAAPDEPTDNEEDV